MRVAVALLALCAGIASAAKGDDYWGKDSIVEDLNNLNFATFIKKPDSMNHVKIIEFYKPDVANCKSFVKEYNELAKQLKGIIKVTAVNCATEAKICKEYGVESYPTLKVIPPGGFGIQDYEGERNAKSVYSWVLKFHNHFVEKVTTDSLDAFLNKNGQKFKALLFTDKGKIPLMWRGLSVDFHGKMNLGVVMKEESGVVGRYKVKKFPTILVVNPVQKKPIKFEDKIEYGELFAFLNRYQETFALDDPTADEEEAAKKPWLSEAVPELTSLSANDICYQQEAVCIIVATKPGADGKLEKGTQDIIMQAKNKFSSGNAKFAYMWLNADRESGFAKATNVEGTPTILALRTGKRTRYARMETDFSFDAMSGFLDRVLGGDVQYKPLKDGPPALTEMKLEEPTKDKKKK